MSHSSSATIASTTQPLSDILPWGTPISVSSDGVSAGTSNNSRSFSNTNTVVVDSRTLLVTDACSADGRFLLHTLALQFLSSRYSKLGCAFDNNSPNINNNNGNGTVDGSSLTMEGAVLWISCAPVAEKQIMMGLRKGLQHNLGGSSASAGAASSWTGGKMSGSSGAVGGIGSSSSSSSSFGQGGGGIGNSSGRIHIVSIPSELADAALDQENGETDTDNGTTNSFSHEGYLKGLHKRIVHWLNCRELMSMQQSKQQQRQATTTTQGSATSLLGPNVVIIDNATALGTLFGAKLTNAFLSSVGSSLRKHAKRCAQSPRSNTTNVSAPSSNPTVTTINLLAVRASSPDDGGLYQIDGDENTMKGEKLRSEYARLLRPWLGFGSGMSTIGANDDGAGTNIPQMEEQSNYLSLSPHSSPPMLYRCGLYEVADAIVDVSPLESGYARDVLGRLSFVTTWSGKGWWGISGGSAGGGNAGKKEEINGAYSSICVNYRCDDSGVRVMRLRTR